MEFHELSGEHVAAVALILALGLAIAWAARRWSPPRQAALGRVLGVGIILYVLVVYIQLGMARALRPEYALPLELCHWVLIACVVSLFHPNRFTAEIAYFWGLAGTLQAILTPDISQTFPSLEFILFFWGHGGPLLAIVFIVLAQGFRPARGSVVRMLLTLNLYGLVAGAVDAAFGWNYGYLCRKPAQRSMLDLLGPWPCYLLSLEVVALVSFSFLYMPWWIYQRQGPKSNVQSSRPDF
jgi:hypothetical integral membrane protein (TIGR02206 family)